MLKYVANDDSVELHNIPKATGISLVRKESLFNSTYRMPRDLSRESPRDILRYSLDSSSVRASSAFQKYGHQQCPDRLVLEWHGMTLAILYVRGIENAQTEYSTGAGNIAGNDTLTATWSFCLY
jgi:hypothetical protein